MIAEINLLEEKQKRNLAPYLIIGLCVFLLVGAFVLLTMQKEALLEQQELLEGEIQRVKENQNEYQQVLTEKSQSQRKELQSKVDELEQTIVPVTPLLERMVALLPERGFFEHYTFSENNKIELLVRFDSMQETAAYTHILSQENYVDRVELRSISTEPIDDTFTYRPRYEATLSVVINEASWKGDGDEG